MSHRRKTDRPKPDRTPSPLMLHTRKTVRSLSASHEAITAKLKRIENAGERLVTGGQTHEDVGTWEILDYDTDEVLARGDGGPDEYAAARKRLNDERPTHHIEDLEDECFDVPSDTPGIPPSLADALCQWVASDSTPYEEIAAVAEMTVREVTDNVAGFRRAGYFL